MLNNLLLSINFVCAGLVLGIGLFQAVNNMSATTDRWIRMAWVFITTGAFGVLTGPMFGYTLPPAAEVVLNVGIAIFVIHDRRRYRPNRTEHDRRATLV
jgi:hypothetical protein